MDLNEQNAAARDAIEDLGKLDECLPGYVERLALGILQEEREQLQTKADHLAEALRQAQTEQRFALQAFEQAQKALDDVGGGALDLAESQMLEYQRQLEQVKENRNRLLLDLACAGIDSLPRTYPEWQKLGREVAAKANEATAKQAHDQDDRYRRYGRVPELKAQSLARRARSCHL